MSPEILVAIITAVSVLGAAVVAALPALRALKRHAQNAVQEDGDATRTATLDALSTMGTRLEARFNARIDDVRDDIDNVREDITRVREWQAGHDAEHIISRPRTGGDTT
ncbi:MULTISPECIES: hypothetical protein [unclassified Streptomyces]|uniref:hypothetical protein n=1 Tax=unclassified Streptomyces TaxID=2593676 RepID=UPI00036BF4B8|nr:MULTISPECIES: hypothetical protein [unclassified Streptomyces]MYY03069.1 hypothetical protein [Streptomyces sp. SID4913]